MSFYFIFYLTIEYGCVNFVVIPFIGDFPACIKYYTMHNTKAIKAKETWFGDERGVVMRFTN